ncbi:MAG: HTTM domain-containing protein [Proteobacteria bacterium]|nr:HTTM domain-containing protein [Pseudomonadota bacterium]
MTAFVSLQGLRRAWNEFFFAPRDTRVCDVIRIGYSFLLLINVLVLAPDLERWFSESGVLPFAASRAVVDSDTLTVFQWLPREDWALWSCYLIMIAQIVMLMIGFLSRVQAICVFIWFVSFSHRFMFLWDGEDNVFRLLGFLLIFCPIGRYYSIDRKIRAPSPDHDGPRPAWGLRLIQFEMSLIYLSTAWEKLNGPEWLMGTALYYVSRLDDVFGRFPVIPWLFETLWVVKLMTWSVLLVECFLPFGLWFKETRRAAIVLGFMLHLSIDYLMVLFLFQWIMMVGLLSFTEPRDWHDLKKLLRFIRARLWRSAGGATMEKGRDDSSPHP